MNDKRLHHILKSKKYKRWFHKRKRNRCLLFACLGLLPTAAIVTLPIVFRVEKNDLSTLITNNILNKTWDSVPNESSLLERVKELNPNININELHMSKAAYEYSVELDLYYLAVVANSNSKHYTGAAYVYFDLAKVQNPPIFLGCEITYYGGDENAPTVDDNKIIFHKNGRYSIKQSGTETSDKLLTADDNVDSLDIIFENNINFIPQTKDCPISFPNPNCNFKLDATDLTNNAIEPTVTTTALLNSQMPGIRVLPNQTLTLTGNGKFEAKGGNIDKYLWDTAIGRDGESRNGTPAGIGGGGGLNLPYVRINNENIHVGTINIIGNVNVHAEAGSGAYDNATLWAADIGDGTTGSYGWDPPVKTLGWIANGKLPGYDACVKKIYINTTGTINANYIGGGQRQNTGYNMSPVNYVNDIIVDNGTIISQVIGSSSYAKTYWGLMTDDINMNIYINGGRIETNRIGTGWGYTSANNNSIEDCALWFKTFTMTGGIVNILQNDVSKYPWGIGNCYCIGGNYTNNNQYGRYKERVPVHIEHLNSTIITKTGGQILSLGQPTDETKMFFTGMSGRLEDGSDNKYLTVHTN